MVILMVKITLLRFSTETDIKLLYLLGPPLNLRELLRPLGQIKLPYLYVIKNECI